jgi:hypothetical protein
VLNAESARVKRQSTSPSILGEVELRALLQKKGVKRAFLFQFSLLEVCDLNSSEENVIGKESHWKNILLSREFGLNQN